MSSTDHHRKQAKLYLRWHREAYFPVAAIIRELLPRFHGLADHDVFRATFKLCDAQELVARKLGHESWLALAKGASLMQPQSDKQQTMIIASEPQIFVSDMAAAIAFYTGRLGFTLAFSHGEPAFYAQVVREGGCLNLRSVNGPVFAPGFREREADALSATMTLDNPKKLFLEYQDADVPFHQRLRTEPWGARTFIVRDPDGNLLAFAGR